MSSTWISATRAPWRYATQLISMESPGGCCFHRQGALGVAGPEAGPAVLLVGQAAGEEARRIVERAQRAEGEGLHLDLGRIAPQQVDKQRCGERSVHDEPWVALDLRRVGMVIVNAVAVESHRGVPE